MTTIAANLECMAADSRVSDDVGCYPTTKIFLIRECIVGAGGNANDTNLFHEWFKAGCKKNDRPALSNDEDARFCAIVLNHQGLFVFNGAAPPDKVERGWHAIGSGAMSAATMLRRGHNPLEAVTEAAEHDNNTGGPFLVLNLSDIKRKRRA
jgi:hypothetical protein